MLWLTAVLEQVPLREVETFQRNTDFLGLNVRFKPYSKLQVSNQSEVLGTLFAVEIVTWQHGIAGCALAQDILFAVERIALPRTYSSKSQNLVRSLSGSLRRGFLPAHQCRWLWASRCTRMFSSAIVLKLSSIASDRRGVNNPEQVV